MALTRIFFCSPRRTIFHNLLALALEYAQRLLRSGSLVSRFSGNFQGTASQPASQSGQTSRESRCLALAPRKLRVSYLRQDGYYHEFGLQNECQGADSEKTAVTRRDGVFGWLVVLIDIVW